MNFAEEVFEHTAKHREQLALTSPEKQLTYRDLWTEATNYSAGLRELGLRGQRIGVYMPNCLDFTPIYYAILLTGNVFVPLDPSYKEELRYLLDDSDAKVLITTERFEQRATRYSADVANCEHVVTRSELFTPTDETVSELVVENDAAVQPYTSGTTGKPKGVVLSHDDLEALTDVITENFDGYRNAPKVLAPLPLFHTYGMTMSLNVPLLQGGQVHLLAEWSAEECLDWIESEDLEVIPAVPAMYRDLLEADGISKDALSSLNTCISRGSKLPNEILEAFEERYDIAILEGFGMTETVKNPLHNTKSAYRFGSVGTEMIPGTVRLVDDDGNEIGPDEIGHLQLHNSLVMDRYYKKPEATEQAFTDDGWFKTDDLMRRDEDGFYYFAGRQDDVIVTGGRNVYPGEVEEIIKDIDSVHDCAVVSMPDERKGQTVKAVVVLENDATDPVSPDRIKQICLDKLAPYKHPREVEITDELPRTPLGKVKREALFGENS